MATMRLIGQDLIELGLITEDQLQAALELQTRKKERLGELLLSLRFLSETDILKVLAQRMRISYITSEKLSMAKVAQPVLEMIPMEFAERRAVLPLMFDPSRQIFSVAANTPNDPKLLKELQLLTQAKDVVAYLAMKPVILAAISRFYRNDPQAFTRLEEQLSGKDAMLAFTPNADPKTVTPSIATGPGLRLADEVSATSLLSDNVFIETLNILISLIELNKGTFRGHSAAVARLAKRVAEKLGLKPREVYFIVVAAYFHEVGKKEDLHYSLVSLKNEKDLRMAQKLYLAPVRLIEMAHYPRVVPDILTHTFERWDGKGFPDGLSGDGIPIGARILSVVDAYEDLVRRPEWTGHPQSEIFRELYAYQGSCFDLKILKALTEVLAESRHQLTDSGESQGAMLMIDASGEFAPMSIRFREAGFRVLVARDTDTAIQTLRDKKVDLVLCDVGSRPLNALQFCRALKTNPPTKDVHFAILSSKDENPKTIQAAFDAGAEEFFSKPLLVEVVLTKIRRLLSRKETLTGMQAQTTPAKASVTGNLTEIPIPDIVQLLANSRKTGMLVIRKGGEEAKVFLSNGRIINCFFKGRDGEEAFYDLLEWEEGEFAFETDVTMPEAKIQLPVENLMLEGYRILDEKRAGISPA